MRVAHSPLTLVHVDPSHVNCIMLLYISQYNTLRNSAAQYHTLRATTTFYGTKETTRDSSCNSAHAAAGVVVVSGAQRPRRSAAAGRTNCNGAQWKPTLPRSAAMQRNLLQQGACGLERPCAAPSCSRMEGDLNWSLVRTCWVLCGSVSF